MKLTFSEGNLQRNSNIENTPKSPPPHCSGDWGQPMQTAAAKSTGHSQVVKTFRQSEWGPERGKTLKTFRNQYYILLSFKKAPPPPQHPFLHPLEKPVLPSTEVCTQRSKEEQIPTQYGAQNLTVFLLDHLSNSPYHTSDNLPVMLGEGLGNILVCWKYFAMFWQHQLKDILSPKSCKSPVTVIVSYGYCAEKRSVGNMYFSPSLLVYFMHLKILCG